MKFKDLPIGTKFFDEFETSVLNINPMIKVSNTKYTYLCCLDGYDSWISDADVYPILEWEDEIWDDIFQFL